MAISQRLTQSRSLLYLLIKGFPAVAYFILLLVVMGQCSSNNAMRQQMEVLQARPFVAQLGSDRQVVISKSLTSEENRNDFIRGAIPNAFAWTLNTSKAYQERCTGIAKQQKNLTLFNQCKSGIDRGVQIPGIGMFTSLIYSYQNIMAPESRVGLLKFIQSQRPEGLEHGTSRILSVDGIGKGELVDERRREYRTPVVMTWHEYQGQLLVNRRSFDSWIYTREVLPTVRSATQTPINEYLAASMQQALYWTKILPLEPNIKLRK